MLARTLTLAACVFTASSAADAQQLLNPFTWFNTGNNSANCANGYCPPNTAYNNPANCANGFCATPAQNGYRGLPVNGYPANNCPGGICPTPYQGNSGYPTNNGYRPVGVPQTYPVSRPVTPQPNYYAPNNNYYNNNQNYYTPNYPAPSNGQFQGLPYSAQQRPLPVNSVSAPRMMNQDNSPFYR